MHKTKLIHTHTKCTQLNKHAQIQSDADIESLRLAMKDGEKSFNREKEDFRKDMENMKQIMKDQMKQIMKEKVSDDS